MPPTPPHDHNCFTDEELKILIKAIVHTTLLSMGLDHSDPMEYQRDLQFLRDWRKSSSTVKGIAIGTAVVTLMTGLLGLVWLAIQNKVH